MNTSRRHTQAHPGSRIEASLDTQLALALTATKKYATNLALAKHDGYRIVTHRPGRRTPGHEPVRQRARRAEAGGPHFNMRVWLWAANPNGPFASTNPAATYTNRLATANSRFASGPLFGYRRRRRHERAGRRPALTSAACSPRRWAPL